MTPKEKAGQLLHQYWLLNSDSCTLFIDKSIAKKCALITVDEILNLCWNGNKTALNYWQEVKKEIENI